MTEVKNFALLIRQEQGPDGAVQMHVRAENQGISDAEVIITVEAWVEKVKERVKQERMGNLTFDKDLK